MSRDKVILRAFCKNDIDSLVLFLNNKNVTKFLTSRIPQPYSIEDAEWWVNTGSKEGINKAVEVNGRYIGTIGITAGQFESNRSAVIGYWFEEHSWGKGIATEAVMEITEYVFNKTNIVRLYATVFSPNKASMRVLEKCGYQLEGILKKSIFKNGVFLDEHLYAKIRS
jgi:RimJ/RimL family protein N-acetyltransferase